MPRALRWGHRSRKRCLAYMILEMSNELSPLFFHYNIDVGPIENTKRNLAYPHKVSIFSVTKVV